jgi:hypothetical protein
MPTRRNGTLPIEARLYLWQRVWDRLLAPPADMVAPPTAGTRDGKPADPLFDSPPGARGVTPLLPRSPDQAATAAYLEALFGTADDGYLSVWTLEDRHTSWLFAIGQGLSGNFAKSHLGFVHARTRFVPPLFARGAGTCPTCLLPRRPWIVAGHGGQGS